MLVLDEADQLLAPQFAADVSRLAMHCGKRAPNGLQTVVVSATLSAQVCPAAQLACAGLKHTRLRVPVDLLGHVVVPVPAVAASSIVLQAQQAKDQSSSSWLGLGCLQSIRGACRASELLAKYQRQASVGAGPAEDRDVVP